MKKFKFKSIAAFAAASLLAVSLTGCHYKITLIDGSEDSTDGGSGGVDAVVSYIDVGQGDCELIQAGGEVNMDGLISKVGVVADGLKRMSKMVITSVCGAAAGAGVSLALGGDFMICADNAKFILAFVNIGLVPDTGATYLLTKSLGTARTMELAATGRPVSAEEAKELGLAYKVVAKEELDEATMKFARKLAAGPLLSYKNIKKQIYDAAYSDYKQWLAETEIPTQRECAASMDFQEGCKAFMEKRKAHFEGK